MMRGGFRLDTPFRRDFFSYKHTFRLLCNYSDKNNAENILENAPNFTNFPSIVSPFVILVVSIKADLASCCSGFFFILEKPGLLPLRTIPYESVR